MGRWVQDAGESECRTVTVRIEGALNGNMPPRESGQTSIGSFSTKEQGKPFEEAEQMTATMIAGAASHNMVNWHAINWQKVHQTVQRLQARIVQAEQAGKRGKVKALQRLLTHSMNCAAASCGVSTGKQLFVRSKLRGMYP